MGSMEGPSQCLVLCMLIGASVEQYMAGMYFIECFVGCMVSMIVCFHCRFAYAWGVLLVVDS